MYENIGVESNLLNLLLEVSDAALSAVRLDEQGQGRLIQHDLIFLYTAVVECLWHQVALQCKPWTLDMTLMNI